VLAACFLLGWLAFVVVAAVRPRPVEVDPQLDVGVYNLAFVAAAIACGGRWRRGGRDRAGWAAMAAAIVLFTVASLYDSLVIGERDVYPSWRSR
jgi:hypothetical protein